jgi:signal peptidase
VEAVGLSLPIRRTRRWLGHAASALFVALLVCLLAVATVTAVGYRVLIDRSDSMAPAIMAGDLIVTKTSRPGDVKRGDIVTFADSSRGGALVTHRVVRKREERNSVSFVTRGDANSGVERWTIASDGNVGKLSFRIPKVGFFIAWLTVPAVRFSFVSIGALLLGAFVVRRIWML